MPVSNNPWISYVSQYVAIGILGLLISSYCIHSLSSRAYCVLTLVISEAAVYINVSYVVETVLGKK